MHAFTGYLQHTVLARHRALAAEDHKANGNAGARRKLADLLERELRREPQPCRAGFLERDDAALVVHGNAGADLGGRPPLRGEGKLGHVTDGDGQPLDDPRVQTVVVPLAANLVEPGDHALGPLTAREVVDRRVDAGGPGIKRRAGAVGVRHEGARARLLALNGGGVGDSRSGTGLPQAVCNRTVGRGGSRVPLTLGIRREQRLLKRPHRGGADLVHGREAHADAFVHLNVKGRRLEGPSAHAAHVLDQVLARDRLRAGRLDHKALGRRARLAIDAGKLDAERLAEPSNHAHIDTPFSLDVRARHAGGGVHRCLRADHAHDGARLDGPCRRRRDGLSRRGVALDVHGEELRRIAHGAQLEQVARTDGLGQANRDLRPGKASHAGTPAVSAAAALEAILERSARHDLAHGLATVVRTLVAHHPVVGLAEQIGVGEVAVEGSLELTVDRVVLLRRERYPRNGRVDGLPVCPDDLIHVVGGLHAPLDLERAHARANHLADVVDSAIVLRAQSTRAAHAAHLLGHPRRRHVRDGHELALLVHELIRQTARLGTQAAVGGAPARQRAHHAHARVAEAQCAVAEALKLHTLLGDARDLGQRQLARERHAVGAERTAPGDAAGVVNVGLCRDVRLDLGPRAADLRKEAPVLDDEGVGAQKPRAAHEPEHARDLVGCHGDVHGDIDARAREVSAAARVAEARVVEVLR